MYTHIYTYIYILTIDITIILYCTCPCHRSAHKVACVGRRALHGGILLCYIISYHII